MRVRDLEGWPPIWGAFYASADRSAVGEIGLLSHVEDDGTSGPLLVVVRREDGTTTTGVLPVCRELRAPVRAVLHAYRGRPLAEVGGAEIQ